MRFLACILVSLGLFAAVLAAQSNPVPFLNQPLVPTSAAPRGSEFILRVSGTGFTTGAVLNWNGSPRATVVISSSSLRAVISTADIARPGTAEVTVTNPAPGGGASNIVYFPVRGGAETVAGFATTTPTVPGPAAVGDFNKDGLTDVAVGQTDDRGNSTILIYLGRGNGTLLPPRQFVSTVAPHQLFVADFNGDGNLDLAVSDNNFYQTAIFLNNGTGFRQRSQIVTGAVEGVADFNGDGVLDLILGETDTQSFWSNAYLGNGDGTFTLSQQVVGAADLQTVGPVAIGDFNRDGKLDVAFPNAVCLGNGNGTFQPFLATPQATGRSIATADLNGDGKLDLVTDTVNVALGNGDGTFTSGNGFDLSGEFSLFTVLGDFNGDGYLDIALAPTDSAGKNQNVSLLLGSRRQRFNGPIVFAADPGGYPALSFALADINRDGELDLVFGRFSVTEVYTQQKP